MELQFPNVEEKILAERLGVARGTVKRWKQTNKVPKQYRADILKLLGNPVDFSVYSYAEKDQFFTPKAVAEYCYKKFTEIVQPDKDTLFVEPSAGNGVFFDLLPKGRRVGLDIEPRHPEVETNDFLDYTPPEGANKVVVIGNPPFGLRGNLALRFINHAYSFADYVAFILPPSFDSDGKGSPMKRVLYSLIHTEKLTSTTFTDPDNRQVKVETVFQILTKNQNQTQKKPQRNDLFKVYSLSDGGTPGTTRNKSKLNACDLYLPSTCFGRDNMRAYKSFEELPNRRGYGVLFKQEPTTTINQICWADVAFLSTNSAYNLRQSLIYETIFNLKNIPL